jgi:hypothetical protein
MVEIVEALPHTEHKGPEKENETHSPLRSRKQWPRRTNRTEEKKSPPTFALPLETPPAEPTKKRASTNKKTPRVVAAAAESEPSESRPVTDREEEKEPLGWWKRFVK